MIRSILDLADDVWNGRAHLNEVREHPAGRPEPVADGIVMTPGSGHAFAIDHGDGLLLFDTGPRATAQEMHAGIRGWSDKPLTHPVYSHGHLDHVFGMGPYDAEAEAAGRKRPVVVAHEGVLQRFAHYDRTRGYNTVINQRQVRKPDLSWPSSYRMPDVSYADEHHLGLDKPYLRPVYDEPEFVVRIVWRRYAGWYDGDPAHLKPAPAAALAAELVALCGGVGALAERATRLADDGELGLAGHPAQLAVQADPAAHAAHAAHDAVYAARARAESSTMAKGIFAWTAAESRAVTSGGSTLGQLPSLAGRQPISL